MSVPIIQIIQDVALKMGDPQFTQITGPEYLSWANQRCRKLATRMNLVKWVAYANVEANNDLYAYPDDLINMTRLQYTNTPSDPSTYRNLRMYFPDEAHARTNWNYPKGEPDSYLPDQGFFYLIGQPTFDVPVGLKIEYWGLPDTMTDLYADVSPIADVLQDLLREGIEIDAKRKLEKVTEAAEADRIWETNIGLLRPKLENRSTDRRSQVRVSRAATNQWRAV